MSERINGIVKWFSGQKGFGFVIADGDDQNEYFVHFSSLIMEGYKTLEADDRVSFVLKDTDKGVQATEVQSI